MRRVSLCALLLLLLLPGLIGCGDQPLHSYTDLTDNAAGKYRIDLSDEGRFSQDGELVISEAGIWRISGSAENKSIVVRAHPAAEILLSFEGASLKSSTGSAVFVERAGSVRLALADGTENSLHSIGENRGGAPVLFSAAPLTVEGGGTLSIVSDGGAGIETVGDAELIGGSVSVKSSKDALRVGGSLTLGKTKLTVDTEGDAVNASEAVRIAGGELFADAGGSGIAASEISVDSGRCDVACSRFIFNTEKDIKIDGGELLLCSYNADGEYGVISSEARIKHGGGQLIVLSSESAPIAEQTLCSAVVTFTDDAESGIISVTDGSGADAVVRERSRLKARCVSICSPSLKVGECYRISIGEITTKLTQSELVSQKTVSTEPAKMTEHEYNGVRYLLYTPAYVSEELPMVVFLHGSGEKGEDLRILTLASSLPRFLLTGLLSIDAYVIMPQLPTEDDGWYKIAAKLETLIEHSRQTLPVIKDKVALTGHSLGGGGVWMLALRHTDRYSKIAPLSGWVDLNDTNLNKLSRIPVWNLVGELDTAVPPEESKPMTDALKAIGADVRSTVFLGAKHHEVPALAYLSAELGLWEWLLS